MSKKECIPYIAAVLALLAGAFYDYQLTDALYHTAPVFGIVFERFVLIPIQSVVMFTMCMLAVYYHRKIFLVVSVLANLYVVQHTLSYWVHTKGRLMLLIMLGIAIGITVITTMCLHRMDKRWIQRHLTFFVFCTIVLLSAAFITTIIKTCWGRIRYRDMQDISQFCVWYKPCDLIGNRSFPSGHTTGAAAVLCLLQWKVNRYKKPHAALYIFVTLFILAMAVSRMIMGAHFLSDTAAGFIVTYTCYLVVRSIFKRRGYL